MQISYLNSNLFCFVPIFWMEESKDCYVDVDVYVYVFFPGEEKGGKYSEKGKISFSGREEIQRRKRRKIFGEYISQNCQGYWEVLILVSVSRLLWIFGKFRFWFRRIWSQKKVSVSENLVLKKVSVSKNLASEKKFRYWFRSTFWYRHSVLDSLSYQIKSSPFCIINENSSRRRMAGATDKYTDRGMQAAPNCVKPLILLTTCLERCARLLWLLDHLT